MSDERNDIHEKNADDGEGALTHLREELEQLKKERQEYLDGWQRSRADYANLMREEREKRERLEEDIVARLGVRLAALADTFEAAMATSKWPEAGDAWRTGVEAIFKDLQKLLQDLLIESYDPIGEQFDPAQHIPTGRTGDGERIVKVERKGYRHKGKVIRPAIVTLGA